MDSVKKYPKWAVWCLAFMFFLALFAEFVANDQPIIGQTNEGQWVLAWTKNTLASTEYQWAIHPPIRFHANTLDLTSANYRPPFFKNASGQTHWLGTDLIGRDVAAGLVYGCRLSLVTAFLATIISLLVGLPIGMLSGFYGDAQMRVSVLQLILGIIFCLLVLYLGSNWNAIHIWFAAAIMLGIGGLIYLSLKVDGQPGQRSLRIPVDTIFTRIVELLISLPGLMLLLTISAIVESKSVLITAIIIGLLRWVRLAQVARNETHSLKEENFIMSARALGFGTRRILARHILPNLLEPILVISIFSMGSFILLESSLSFLGIGVALEQQTWGSMLAQARQYFNAWWLALFPGTAIFIAILALYSISEKGVRREQRTAT